jgi:hypothetical protein
MEIRQAIPTIIPHNSGTEYATSSRIPLYMYSFDPYFYFLFILTSIFLNISISITSIPYLSLSPSIHIKPKSYTPKPKRLHTDDSASSLPILPKRYLPPTPDSEPSSTSKVPVGALIPLDKVQPFYSSSSINRYSTG